MKTLAMVLAAITLTACTDYQLLSDRTMTSEQREVADMCATKISQQTSDEVIRVVFTMADPHRAATIVTTRKGSQGGCFIYDNFITSVNTL